MSRDQVRIDPDHVAALAQEMLTLSAQLRPLGASVVGSDIVGCLGRAGVGSPIGATYSACAQDANGALDNLCAALENNAEYVQAAAQDGDEAFS